MTSAVQQESKAASDRKGRSPTFRLLRVLACLVFIAPATVGAAAASGLDNRVADILAQFVAPALTLSVLLALCFGLLRWWPAAVTGLGVALLLITAVYPQWSPDSARALRGAPAVRLYSANVWYLNDDIGAMRRSIEAADADVIILIELGKSAVGQVDELLAGYPHRASSMRLDATRGPSRSVIASRYPLSPLQNPPDGLHAVAAQVRSPIGPLNVVGVHLTRPWPFQHSWGQISQTMALGRMTGRMSGPVVVAGDFNSVSSARIGRQVKTDLGLLPAPAMLGTWPSNLPPVAGIVIDQVYASPDLAFVSRTLGQPNGSDHRPVVTEVTRAAD